MYQQKLGARAEYLKREAQRVSEAPTLSNKFTGLKSLTINLSHYDPTGTTRTCEVKYQVNIAHVKSVFRFACPNGECVRGDFDLSEELAEAIDKEQTTLVGETHCPGWRSKTTIDTVHCNNMLRYKITLGYE